MCVRWFILLKKKKKNSLQTIHSRDHLFKIIQTKWVSNVFFFGPKAEIVVLLTPKDKNSRFEAERNNINGDLQLEQRKNMFNLNKRILSHSKQILEKKNPDKEYSTISVALVKVMPPIHPTSLYTKGHLLYSLYFKSYSCLLIVVEPIILFNRVNI